MADPEDLSPERGAGSDNGEMLKDARDEAEDVAQLVEEEMQDHPTPVEIGNGSVADRYRQIMHETHQDVSDVSSLGGSSLQGLPKRAGSPIDSVVSGPDDTPSIQVLRSSLHFRNSS